MFTAVHDNLATVEPAGLTRADLERLVGELARVEAHAAERRLAVSAALDRLAEADRGLTGADVNRVKAKRSAKTAKRDATVGRVLQDMPRMRSALARGDINTEHAQAAVAAAERVSADEADRLVSDARSRPADLFARQARSWASAREREDAKEDRKQRQLAAREVSWWTDVDGMWNLHGRFDPDTGHAIQKRLNTEIDRLWRDDGGRDGTPDDERTPPQRKADALATLVTAPPVAGSRRPHPKHLIAIRADHTRLRGDPEGIAEYTDGSPIPQTTLERLTCDTAFVGFVYDQHGETLYQGRTTRLATDAQWTNLIARDRGCICCEAPPEHCHAHHLTPWAPPARGPTDIDHLALVCTRTHHLIHDHGYRVIRDPEGHWRIEPPGRAAAAGSTATAAA